MEMRYISISLNYLQFSYIKIINNNLKEKLNEKLQKSERQKQKKKSLILERITSQDSEISSEACFC